MAEDKPIDLKELSREPFVAEAWRKRREAAEARAVIEETSAPVLKKLDFFALVLPKHLHTRASLLAYVQDHGPPAAQQHVCTHQRKLDQFLEDAAEWADAKAVAGAEKLNDRESSSSLSVAEWLQRPRS